MPSEESTKDAAEHAAPSFEEAMMRLEAIVRELEEGRIGLAEALARYEQGVALLTQCQTMLETAEQRIEMLTGVDAQGRPITAPFEHTDSASATETNRTRTRRRTAPAAPPPEDPCDEEPPSLF